MRLVSRKMFQKLSSLINKLRSSLNDPDIKNFSTSRFVHVVLMKQNNPEHQPFTDMNSVDKRASFVYKPDVKQIDKKLLTVSTV